MTDPLYLKLPWSFRRIARESQWCERIAIKPECMEWLAQHVGERDVDWAIYSSGIGTNQHMAVKFFRPLEQMPLILQFKLTWAGM